jgi:serine/threonine-protein kinase
VFIDGERQGLTPRNLRSLPFGSHTVRVTRPRYAPQERVVTLSAEQPSVLAEFTLRPAKASPSGAAADEPAARTKPTPSPRVPPKAAGAPRPAPTPVIVATSLSIETRPPGARVRVDGRDVGVTPLTVTPLDPGPHRLELQLPGYRLWSSTLTLAAGQRRRLTASLERESIR